MRDLLSKYNHFNDLNKANIKSSHYRHSIYITGFYLYYKAFETAP